MRSAVRGLLLGSQRYSAPQGADRWAAAVVANGGTVSAARLSLITALIDGLMVCGHWWATDDMALLAAENEAAALTTLKGRILMAAVAAPTFTIDRDYACNGTTQYINTNWTASLHAKCMSLGNARLGIYERVNLASTTTSIGVLATPGTLSMRARSASTTMLTSLHASNVSFTIAADSRGLKVVSRVNNLLPVSAWERGVALAPIAASGVTGGLAAFPLFIGARNNAGTADQFRAGSFAWGEWGAPLPGSTPAELAAYNALQAHLTAIEANV